MAKRVETIPSTQITRGEQLRLLALGHRYQFVGMALVAVGGVANCTFRQSERSFDSRSEAEAYVASFVEADVARASVSVYGPATLAGTHIDVRLAYNTL